MLISRVKVIFLSLGLFLSCQVNVVFAEEGTSGHAEVQAPPQSQTSRFDYSLGFGARAVPFGAAAYGDLGYSFLIWGEKKNDGFLYGFLRPAIRLQSSIFITRAEGYLEFAPISILNFGAGGSWTTRGIDNYAYVNCNSVACMGTIWRKWARAKLTLGYRDFYFLAVGRYETLAPSLTQTPFVDEYNMLLGSAGGDSAATGDFSLGYKISQTYVVGVHYGVAHMLTSRQSNIILDAYAGRKWGPWSVYLGVGAYDSTLQSVSPTGYLILGWNGMSSLALD